MRPSGIIRQYRFAKCHGVTNPACDGQEQPAGKTKDCPSPSLSLWMGCQGREMDFARDRCSSGTGKGTKPRARAFLEQYFKFTLRWWHEIAASIFIECRLHPANFHLASWDWIASLPSSLLLLPFLLPLASPPLLLYFPFFFPVRQNQVFSTSMWVTKLLEIARKHKAFYLMAKGSNTNYTKVRKSW